MLFSATMPDPIITLARTFMNQPTHIRAEAPHSAATHDTTEQFVYRAHALDKVEMVSRILQAHGRGATMIFTRTKRTAQKVADELAERGFKVGAVHGDLGQVAREKALKAFRTGDVDVLVATDVAARGIDIDDITHVINYQIPEDEQAYVHRIGRTGRAGKTGIAVTLVDWDELPRWTMIDKALGLDCPDPAETYSNSPHLYDELGHPHRAPADRSARARSTTRPEPGRSPRDDATSARARSATARGGAPAAASRPPATSTAGDRQPSEQEAPTPAAPSASALADRPSRAGVAPRNSARAIASRRLAHFATPMVKPERRTKRDSCWRRRSHRGGRRRGGGVDLVEQRRAGHDQPACRRAGADPISAARAVPATRCAQLWTAPSPGTTEPVVVAGTVVTGDGPRAWRAGIPRPASTAGPSPATATCAASPGCTTSPSRSTPTVAAAGRSAPSRQAPANAGRPARAYADKQVTLSTDGTTVLSAGHTRLEMWRSDMVRMLGYGDDRRADQTRQYRRTALCTLLSAAASSSAASVLEACREQADLRLTLLKPSEGGRPAGDQVRAAAGRRAPTAGARVLAVSDTTTAVYLPHRSRGSRSTTRPAPEMASTLLHPRALAGPGRAVSRAGDLITWWTGDSVEVFDGNSLAYRYTDRAPGSVAPLGPADDDGRTAADPGHRRHRRVRAGDRRRRTPHSPSHRPATSSGPVVPAVAGSIVVEQRGDDGALALRRRALADSLSRPPGVKVGQRLAATSSA